MKTFQWRAAHEYWHSVIYIQTNVKSRIGCGTPIVVKFRAPLKSENLDQEIVYDYQSLGEDADLVINGREERYCLKQCYKMCYYVQKVHNQEILRMKAEFSKDENGTVRPLCLMVTLDLVRIRLGAWHPCEQEQGGDQEPRDTAIESQLNAAREDLAAA